MWEGILNTERGAKESQCLFQMGQKLGFGSYVKEVNVSLFT